MYYDKRIRYLNYYESGIKLQNAGYVKFQVRDNICQMILYIKGPRLMGSGEAAVYLLSEKEAKKQDGLRADARGEAFQRNPLGNISIRNGQGHCAVRMNTENMGDTGLWYDEVCGIRVELHEYQYLESTWTVLNLMPGTHKKAAALDKERSSDERWRENGQARKETDQEAPVEINLRVTPVSGNVRVEKIGEEETAEQEENRGMEAEEPQAAPQKDGGFIFRKDSAPLQEKEISGRKGISLEEAVALQEIPAAGKEEADGKNVAIKAEEETGQEDSLTGELQEQTLDEEIRQSMAEASEEICMEEQELKPDKWEQLRKTYPVVHPIREEEEYLKIAPKDFVIFTEKYQELVHNSFLLHGYYNYKHLILGKREKDGKTVYYLGVPGTFHEREKTVAVMFGFEAFDGKREPAEKGDFGYYLRRVEL